MSVFILSSPFCVLLALLLAYIPHWIRTFAVVRPALAKTGKPYDVRYSRLETQRATTDTPQGLLIARLTGCHLNGLEAFAYFGIAVAIATLNAVPASTVDALSTAFIIARTAYSYIYITGVEAWKGPMRSILFAVGLVICALLFAFAVQQRNQGVSGMRATA